jgi:hypothetical protein
MAQWQDVTIAAGEIESAEIPIPYEEIVVPAGRITDADGQKVQRADRPKYDVEESGSGSKIVLAAPADQDLTFKVKPVDDPDEPPVAGQLPA